MRRNGASAGMDDHLQADFQVSKAVEKKGASRLQNAGKQTHHVICARTRIPFSF